MTNRELKPPGPTQSLKMDGAPQDVAITVNSSQQDVTHSLHSGGPGEKSPPSGPALEVGAMLNQYRIEAKLGQGGMGAVYKALQTRLGKHVALKVLPAHLTRDAAVVARFDREMKAVGRLEHPHIVRAMDAGDVDGMHYLVMEYVEGLDLSQLVRKKGARSVIEACELVRQAAVGLAHAHENGLIHRDIKPSNLLLSKQGKLKILDLGLARLQGSGDDEGDEATAGLTLTTQGVSMGTPDYMAPEQWGNTHAADARADIYALGCTLYYLLTGHAPYDTKKHATFVAKMKAHVIEPIPDLKAARPEVPDELNTLYRHMLAKEPAERTSSAAEVAKSLARIIRALRGGGSTVQDRPADVPTRPEPGVSVPAANDELQSALAAISIVSAPRRVADQSPQAVRKRPGCLPVALAGGLAAALLLAGIITITIRNRDGSTTRIEVPDGAKVEVAQDDNPPVTFPAPAAKPAEPIAKADQPPANAKLPDRSDPAVSPATSPAPENWLVELRVPANILGLESSRDGKWLACNDWNGTVRVYDTNTVRLVRMWRHGVKTQMKLAFSPEGRLASILIDGPTRHREVFIDSMSSQQTSKPQVPDNWDANAISWSPDGERLALGSNSGQLAIWDENKQQWTDWSSPHSQGIRQVAFSPDGARLAALGADGLLSLADARTGDQLLQVRFQDSSEKYERAGAFAWSPDGQAIAVTEATDDPLAVRIRTVSASTGSEVRNWKATFRTSTSGPATLQWLEPDRLLVMLPHAGMLFANPQAGEFLNEKPILEGVANLVRARRNELFVSIGSEILARIDVSENSSKETFRASFPSLRCIAWQPGGKRLNVAVQPADRKPTEQIFAFDVLGRPAWSTSQGSQAYRVAWAPGGQQLFAMHNGELRSFDATGKLLDSIHRPELTVDGNLTVSPNGKNLAVRQLSNVHVFDRAGSPVTTITPVTGDFGAIAWSPDSQWLALGKEGGLQLWQPDGTLGPAIDNPPHKVRHLAFSSQGWLAATCTDRRLLVWDEKRQFQSEHLPSASRVTGVSICWNPAGDTIAVGYRDGTVELTDKQGKLRRVLLGRMSNAQFLEWSSDGRYLGAMFADSSLCIWSADGQLVWTGFVLPDGSQVSLAGDGKLLHGNPQAIDEHLSFFVTDGQGKQQALSYEAFQKWREKAQSGVQSKSVDQPPVDADPQRAAALAVFKAGGNIVVNDFKGRQYTVTKAADLPQAFFVRIVYLHGAAGPFGDVFARLARLPHLQGYSGDAPLTDAELAQLGGLDFQFATFLRARVTDQSAAVFAQWRNAYAIDLKQMAVVNATCRTLGQLPSLTRLNLEGSQVSDAGLAELAKCRKLSSLNLAYGTGFTSQGIASLRESPLLAYLSLIDCPVGDEIVEPLSTAQQIRLINLAGTKVSADGARRLQKALPKCCVYHPATRDNSGNQELVRWLLAQEPAKLRDAVRNEAITKDQAQPLPFGSIAFPTKSPPGTEANRLAAIFGLRELEWPNLKQADAAAKHFGQLDGLRTLRLRGSDLSGEGLVHLAPLARLEHLDLSGGAKLNDAALESLPTLPLLNALNLDSSPVRGPGLQHLARAPGLQELYLTRCWDLDSSGLKHLPPLDQLRFLGLVGTKIDDEAVPHLSRYTSLRFLQVHYTKITAEGVAQLRKALPRCAIHWNGGFIVPAEENSTIVSPDKNPVVVSGDPDPQRAAALAVFEAGGNIVVIDAKGGRYSAFKAADLPQGPFFIRGVYLHGVQSLPGEIGAKLEKLPHLTVYSGDAPLTDADLTRLAALDLQSAHFKKAAFTDQSAPIFARWQNALAIGLDKMTVGDATCRALGQLPLLSKLSLEGSQISDAGLAELAKARKLSVLDLTRATGITSQGLARCSQNPSLRFLSLVECPLGDEIVEPLSAARQLRVLNLTGTKVSAEGALKLQQALSETCVYHPAIRTRSQDQELVRWLLAQEPSALHDAVLNAKITKDQKEFLPVGVVSFAANSPPATEAARFAAAYGLHELEWPNLIEAEKAVELLGKHDGLKKLNLRASDLSGKGLSQLAGLTRLEDLRLPGSRKLDDAALEGLPSLPLLHTLHLNGCLFRGAGLQYLSRTPDIHELDLAACNDLDSSGLKNLPTLNHLRFLFLSSTKIDDEAVAHLGRYPSLRYLHVSNTNITAAGAARLHQSLPRCAILWNGGLIVPETSAAAVGANQAGASPESTAFGK